MTSPSRAPVIGPTTTRQRPSAKHATIGELTETATRATTSLGADHPITTAILDATHDLSSAALRLHWDTLQL